MSPTLHTPSIPAPHAGAELLLDRLTVTHLAARGNHPAARAWLRAYRAACRQRLGEAAARARCAAAWDRCCVRLRASAEPASRGC